MADKNEKDRRKQIQYELKKKAALEFENSLPMSRENFNLLFDFLDNQLELKNCDHSTILTQRFLQDKKLKGQKKS